MRAKMVTVTIFLFIMAGVYNDGEARRGGQGGSDLVKIVGAEPGGNKTGEITPFEGDKGLKCPRNYEKGDFLPNPYKDEKRLFRINYKNVNKYKERLSPGQVLRLKKHKKYYIDVYPIHRNMVFPDEFYRATEKNKKTCRLDKNNKMSGYNGGVPFPSPKRAEEVVWNLKKQYYGDDAIGIDEVRRVVSPSGRIKKSIWTTRVLTFDKTRLGRNIPNPDKVEKKILALYTYPADVAGTAMLTIQYLDDERPDDAWLYIPTLRRVRRAPSMTEGGQIDGESTMDELGYGFRGPVNDWTWKLLGKKELYIPVNCYDMWKVGASDEEECLKGDINPEGTRYELRRVWVIEGRIKKGISHPYSRRVEYIDEDTWTFALGDRYDRRDNLWRMCVFYTYYDYCQKFRAVPCHIYMNLESGRYEVRGGGRTKDTKLAIVNSGLDPGDFTVQNLRRVGR